MLRISIDELYKQEMECYMHKLSEGDITPLVFDMLKETKDLNGLLEYLGYHEETLEEQSNVVVNNTFAELFGNGVEVI